MVIEKTSSIKLLGVAFSSSSAGACFLLFHYFCSEISYFRGFFFDFFTNFFSSSFSHWIGPLSRFSLRIAMSVCVYVCLLHQMQFPGLSLVLGRSASTIDLKRRGWRASTIEIKLWGSGSFQRWNMALSGQFLFVLVSVLLYASVKRFSVSRMRDFFNSNPVCEREKNI